MGDRGNIVVLQHSAFGEDVRPDGAIYLYSHWGGSDLPNVLAEALRAGEGRWRDESYLCRIIFNRMTAGQEMGETGFGISAYITDNSHPLLVVDTRRQEVRIVPEGADVTKPASAITAWSFADFSRRTFSSAWESWDSGGHLASDNA